MTLTLYWSSEFQSRKIQRIIDIWEENYGVVSLHCFHSVIPSEAYTREAAMLDAIGKSSSAISLHWPFAAIAQPTALSLTL